MDEEKTEKAGRRGSRLGNVVCFVAALPVGYGIAEESYGFMLGGLILLGVYAAVQSRAGRDA